MLESIKYCIGILWYSNFIGSIKIFFIQRNFFLSAAINVNSNCIKTSLIGVAGYSQPIKQICNVTSQTKKNVRNICAYIVWPGTTPYLATRYTQIIVYDHVWPGTTSYLATRTKKVLSHRAVDEERRISRYKVKYPIPDSFSA